MVTSKSSKYIKSSWIPNLQLIVRLNEYRKFWFPFELLCGNSLIQMLNIYFLAEDRWFNMP